MASFHVNEIESILDVSACARGTRRRLTGVSIDSRNLRPGSIFIAIRGDRYDGHAFVAEAVARGAAAVILSKGSQFVVPQGIWGFHVDDTTEALNRLAGYHRRRFSIPVIAVTGSAGKTTTKEMIARVLAQRFCVLKNHGSLNNQWGVALTLLRLTRRYTAAVVEIGTNHPGEVAFLAQTARPTIAVLTNIGQAHLAGFGSRRNIFKEKSSLIRYLEPGGSVVFNADDTYLSALRVSAQRTYSYGLSAAADLSADCLVLDRRGRMCFRIKGKQAVCLKTPVADNVSNALAAAACGEILRVPLGETGRALESVSFCRHRQQIVRKRGILIIDDTYNSNPLSLRSAVKTLFRLPVSGRRVLVCGDMLELGDQAEKIHYNSGREIAKNSPDVVLTFGRLSRALGDGVRRGCRSAEVLSYDSIEDLVRRLRRCLSRGDAVLVKGSRGMRMERVVASL